MKQVRGVCAYIGRVLKLSFVLTHGTLDEVMPVRMLLAPVDDGDSEPNGTVIGYSVLFRESVLAYE